MMLQGHTQTSKANTATSDWLGDADALLLALGEVDGLGLPEGVHDSEEVGDGDTLAEAEGL